MRPTKRAQSDAPSHAQNVPAQSVDPRSRPRPAGSHSRGEHLRRIARETRSGESPNKSPAALDVTLARQNLSISTTWGILFGEGVADRNIWRCMLQKISHILLCALKVHNCPLLVLPLQYITAYPAREYKHEFRS